MFSDCGIQSSLAEGSSRVDSKRHSGKLTSEQQYPSPALLLGLWDPVEFLGEQQCFAVVFEVSYWDLLFDSVCVCLLKTHDETLTNALTSALYCVQ